MLESWQRDGVIAAIEEDAKQLSRCWPPIIVRIWCSACNRIDGPLLISGAGADTGAVAVKYSLKRTLFWQTYPDVCRQTRPTWLVGLDTRPPGFGGTTRGPTLHPTFAVRRDSRIEWGHRSSASRSRILKRFFPLLVSPHLRISAPRIFCCGFHQLQFLNRWPRVCVL